MYLIAVCYFVDALVSVGVVCHGCKEFDISLTGL